MNENHQHDVSEPASVVAQSKKSTYHQGAYNLAFLDDKFLTSHETRGIRFQAEISKPDIVFKKQGIKHTIVVFGSARFKDPETARKNLQKAIADGNTEDLEKAIRDHKNSRYYQAAYDFGKLVAERNLKLSPDKRLHILTGGGPGVMEAANRGAFEAGDKTIGMNIALPFEQEPNPYITPELCFDFHYFACRKFSFLSAGSSTDGVGLVAGEGYTSDSEEGGGGAAAMVCFAGGFGTLDEWFEAITLIQTKKMRPRPMILVDKAYWSKVVNFQALVEEGAISPDDMKLFHIVDTPDEAWDIIKKFYALSF